MATQQRDPELDAVREAVALRTRERELSLARAWGTIVARRAGVDDPPDRSVAADRAPGERRSPARRLVPMTAAATVAAVAIGTVTLLGPQWGGFGFLPGNPGSPSDHETYFPNLDPPSEEAVAWLNELAAAAEQGEPVRIEEGQLVYVRSDGWAMATWVGGPEAKAPPGWPPMPSPGAVAASPSPAVTTNPTVPASPEVTSDPEVTGPQVYREIVPQPREHWFDPDGMVSLLTKAGEETLGGGERGGGQPRESSRPAGPYAPTPEWLAGLPTDPDRLRAQLREQLRDDQTWSTDHAVWTAMSELYASAEILIPPEVRAALLRAFTELRGLTAVEARLTASDPELDGRRLIGIRHIERGGGDEILFDTETGRAIGRRSVSVDSDLSSVVVPTDAPFHPGLVRILLDQGITYQSLWTQAIVDEVGETG